MGCSLSHQVANFPGGADGQSRAQTAPVELARDERTLNDRSESEASSALTSATVSANSSASLDEFESNDLVNAAISSIIAQRQPWQRGVSLSFLRRFAAEHDVDRRSTDSVVSSIIRPVTAERRQPYVDVLDLTAVGTPSYYVAHAWHSPFASLLSALLEFCAVHEPDADESRLFFWLDIFALPQHPRPRSSADRGDGASGGLDLETVMSRAMSASCGTVLCCADSSASALDRTWCLFEIWQTIGSPAAVSASDSPSDASDPRLFVSWPSSVMPDVAALVERVAQLDVASAQTSIATDRERLLGAVRSRPLELPEFNDHVRQALSDSALAECSHVRAMPDARQSQLLPTILRAAILLQASGDLAEAEEVLRHAVALADRTLSDDHPQVASCYSHLARLLCLQGDDDGAEPLFRRALQVRQARRVSSSTGDLGALASDLSSLASLEESRGRLDEAETHYRRAVDVMDGATSPDARSLAECCHGLAELLRTRGALDEAEPPARRALSLWESLVGAAHGDLVVPLNSLALILVGQDRYHDAEPLYRRALSLAEAAFGADDLAVATTLNGLAELLSLRRLSPEAEPLYRRSLAIREQKLGERHPHVAASLNNLAALLQTRGRYAAAEPLYRRAMEVWEAVQGPDDPIVANVASNLAELLEARGKFAEAETLFWRALSIRQEAYGPDHPLVSQSMQRVASVRSSIDNNR